MLGVSIAAGPVTLTAYPPDEEDFLRRAERMALFLGSDRVYRVPPSPAKYPCFLAPFVSVGRLLGLWRDPRRTSEQQEIRRAWNEYEAFWPFASRKDYLEELARQENRPQDVDERPDSECGSSAPSASPR